MYAPAATPCCAVGVVTRLEADWPKLAADGNIFGAVLPMLFACFLHLAKYAGLSCFFSGWSARRGALWYCRSGLLEFPQYWPFGFRGGNLRGGVRALGWHGRGWLTLGLGALVASPLGFHALHCRRFRYKRFLLCGCKRLGLGSRSRAAKGLLVPKKVAKMPSASPLKW